MLRTWLKHPLLEVERTALIATRREKCIADNGCRNTQCSVHQSMDSFTGGLLTSSTEIVRLCHTLELVPSSATQRS
jgi:hypothetical protein